MLGEPASGFCLAKWQGVENVRTRKRVLRDAGRTRKRVLLGKVIVTLRYMGLAAHTQPPPLARSACYSRLWGPRFVFREKVLPFGKRVFLLDTVFQRLKYVHVGR